RYTVPTDRTRIFVSCAGTYASGELYVVKEVDEDNHVRYEFTDKEGRIVLTRSINGNEGMDDTYYIYDIFGNLRVVLPPMCSANFYSGSLTDSASVLSDYAFLYKYDTRNRCIGKKQPGCEWVELVYDRCDRLIFTQNGKERANNEWAFHLEDLSGRSVLTGVYLGTPDFQNCASEDIYAEFTSNTDSPYYGYTIYGLQNHYLDIQQVYFYDTYEYQNLLPDSLSSLWYVFDNNYGERYENSQSSPHCKEQLTGSIVRILGTEEYQYASYYYDYYHNLIQERKTTSGGNKKVNKSLFNILKQPVSVRSEYEGGVLNKLYSYDRAGRLIHERHCVVSKDTVDLLYGYDKLGRLKRLERIHGKDSVITENAYNIRSWLTGIDSNAGFVEQLHYVDGLGIPCYNGNISSMTWEVDGMKRGYKFMYDGRSRLLRAVYGEGEGLNVNQDRFNEEITGYDKNGNILGIKRCGKRSEDEYGLIDNLVMSYNGNQLKAVSDSVTGSAHADSFEFKDGADLPVEYYYDSNGNLIQDLNKKISEIQYNCLNLPSRIEFEDGGVISYLYDAKGTKFRTTHVIAGKTTTTDYFDDAIYENGVLTTLLTELGYISLVDGKYHYYLKDHQGNNRVVVGQNGSVEEVNHYYPFGGTFASTSSVQPYKYNGKELDRQGGLDWYDYGARHYDVALGRWHVVDPMAEKYYLWSPYAYCLGNPVRFIDPTGMVTEIPPGFWASFGKGFSQPFVSFWNAVTHPVETVTNVVNSIKSVTPTEAGFGVGEQVLRSPMSPLGSTFNQLDVAQAIAYDKANGTMTSAEVIGNQWGDIAFDAVTTAVGAGVGRGTGLYKGQTLVTNSIPQKVARVIPDGIKTSMLGAPNQSDVFVTAAKDIKGLNAMQIANKLTIPQSSSGFKVIEFRTPMNGLASPINRTNPGFVGKGRTLGGAREFTIPNQQIPKDAIIKIVK
ncbi:polymorphic toxin type 10 domain-containing protein, partial [Bacteroides xylanisolvens]|uniref:polymorphic toxin type 10 domain-containing protein n=1 Tax=Bacteroides xylanisolvens TaxID=371601 RepID=UPI00125FCC1C